MWISRPVLAVLIGGTLGLLLFVEWAADAWPGFFVVENRLGPAECTFQFEGGDRWVFSVDAGEKVQRFFPFGSPRDWHWQCQTSEGPVSYSSGGCGAFGRERRRNEILQKHPFSIVC